MAEKKEKAIEKDQETKTPAGAKKDELSEEDVEKVAGGMRCDALTRSDDCNTMNNC